MVDPLQELLRRRAILIRDGDLSYYEVADPFAYLKWCTDHGFLLHGSALLLDRITPKLASDIFRGIDSRAAVYMSSHPEAPMFMSLAGGTGSKYTVIRYKNGKIQTSFFSVKDLSKIRNHGFVHVIDPKNVDDILDGDHVAYHHVTPLLAIIFKRSDFPYPITEY